MSVASTAHGLQDRVAAYATLLRIPNLFTAPPDVLLGAVLAGFATTESGVVVPVQQVASLSVVSMLLYGAGTTLNDYADTEVDAVERPERPIPSQSVSSQAALSFGVGLLVAAVATAFILVGIPAMIIALVLGYTIILYDFYLKDTTIGFGAMGLTRGLNIVLGMTAFGDTEFSGPMLFVPVVISGYIATVTWMAADEMTGGTQRRILVTRTVAVVVALTIVLLGVVLQVPLVRLSAAVFLMIGFFVVTTHQLQIAYQSQTPETIGAAVGSCVLGLVVIDTAIIALFTLRVAAITFGFFLAARLLSGWFDIS